MPARPGDELRGAVIGFGLAGSVFHAPLIASTPGLAVAAIVTGNAERAAQAREAHPDAEVIGNPDAVFDRAGDLDFVVVATPNDSHAELAERAIDAGLPVVVDKPLAPNAARGRAIVEKAEAAGVTLAVFLNRRWDSDQLTIARLLDEGRLGKVHRHESRFERWRPASREGAWREDTPPKEGGGLLLDLGPHLVDQAVALHGPVERLFAEIAHRRGGAADDDLFVALHHASGVESHIWASVMAASPGPRRRVLGGQGTFTVPGLDSQEKELREGRLPGGAAPWGEEPEPAWGRLATGHADEPIRSEPGDWPAFYAGFERSLREGAPPPVDARDAVAVLEVLDAARRSAATASVIDLS